MMDNVWSPFQPTFEPCRTSPHVEAPPHSYVFGAVAE